MEAAAVPPFMRTGVMAEVYQFMLTTHVPMIQWVEEYHTYMEYSDNRQKVVAGMAWMEFMTEHSDAIEQFNKDYKKYKKALMPLLRAQFMGYAGNRQPGVWIDTIRDGHRQVLRNRAA